jgi:hypothetical protein
VPVRDATIRYASPVPGGACAVWAPTVSMPTRLSSLDGALVNDAV